MADKPAVGDIVKNITDDVKTIVQGEIALAKAELVPSAKSAGIGAGLFGAAGYLGLNAASLLFLAGAGGLGMLIRMTGLGYVPSMVLGLIAMAVILGAIAGGLALAGKSKVQQAKPPQETIAQAKESVAALTTAVERGQAGVVAEVNDRKALRSTRGEATRAAEQLR